MIKSLLTSLSAILALNSAPPLPQQYHPKSVVIMEVESGEIFYEENMHEKVELASTSKLMSIYVALKEIEAGKVKLGDKFTTTSDIVEIATLPGVSTNYMIEGKQYSLQELILLNLLPSSNAASVMLAKALYGNETQFVEKMNEYAKELKMENTFFVNSSGLENKETSAITKNTLEGESTSTAYDMALFLRDMILKYPQITEFSKEKEVVISKDSIHPETLTPSYKMFLEKNNEYIGLKTGTGEKGGYNFIALANHNNKYYLVLLFGVGPFLSNPNVRYDLADSLMQYAFIASEDIVLLEKGEHHLDNKDIKLEEDFVVSSNRNSYGVDLKENKLRFIQEGKYLDGSQKIIEKEVSVLRVYEYHRFPLQYLGVEIGLIAFIIYHKKRKYQHRYK